MPPPRRTREVDADLFNTVVHRMRASLKPAHLLGVMSWYLWYDYFSVPQPDAPEAESDQHTDITNDLGRAVASLSAYIHACSHFFVLAPMSRTRTGGR